jgi:rod shape-determining protein MreC
MARSVKPRPIIIAGIAVILIANAVVFGGRLTAWVADISGPLLASASDAMSRARALAGAAVSRGNLAARNVELEDEVLRLRAQLANQDDLRTQLEFYRNASGIRDRTGKEPISAGIFSYPQAGGVHQVVINRGRADWVVVGDIVATPTGAVVGAVSQVFEHHAVVRMVGDIGLEITVHILGTDVSGLLRSTENGVIVDLVQKNETVTEQAVVTTSGDDWYPAGLVVGTVRSVDNDAATLFKIVRVAPAVTDNISGSVIVIRP